MIAVRLEKGALVFDGATLNFVKMLDTGLWTVPGVKAYVKGYVDCLWLSSKINLKDRDKAIAHAFSKIDELGGHP